MEPKQSKAGNISDVKGHTVGYTTAPVLLIDLDRCRVGTATAPLWLSRLWSLLAGTVHMINKSRLSRNAATR